MSRLVLMVLTICSAVNLAAAQDIDLSKPYGNEDGCANRVQQEYYSDDMLLLTDTELVTSTSACHVAKTTKKPDGTIAFETMCDNEGEDTQSAAGFIVGRSRTDPSALAILNEDGDLFGEVRLCK